MPPTLRRFLRPIYRRARSLPVAFPFRVQCNICGWRGRHFISNRWHAHSVCPICDSQIRHRLLVAAWSNIDRFSYDCLVRDKRVLHFGPEAYIAKLLKRHTSQYATADYLRRDVNWQLDISSMPTVADNRYDLVIACDVLEHVTDDLAAMRELHRIVKPGGYAILTVPQKDDLEETFEDSTVTDSRERERLFGQRDHLRIYGRSFPRLLTEAGFEVAIVDEQSFSADMIKRHVLFPLKMSTHPLVTNFRKVFFAQKLF